MAWCLVKHRGKFTLLCFKPPFGVLEVSSGITSTPDAMVIRPRFSRLDLGKDIIRSPKMMTVL